MACRIRKFRMKTLYPHKRSEGLRRCKALERLTPWITAQEKHQMATKEQLEKHKQFLLEQEAKRRQADIDRKNDVLSADYSGYNSIEEIWKGLSSAEINLLKSQSPSYKKRVEELDLIAAFRRLSEEDQAVFFAEANEATRITLENDGYVASQTTTLAKSPGEAQDEAEAARLAQQNEAGIGKTPEEIQEENERVEAGRLQAEADRVAAEAAAANTTVALPRDQVEVLYDGVEKLANNAYRLTVDPEDGTPVEVFWGESQKECFKKLRESKVQAVRELRRRRKQLEITQELRDLQPEVVAYAPLMQAVSLTPKEIYDLTEQQKDPSTVLEATRKLRQASYTLEECARYNEAIERQRYNDQKTVAEKWISGNPDFHASPENIGNMQKLMGQLNWAVTEKNLDLAFKTLKEQEAYVPEVIETPPPAQPAFVVPVAPVVTPKVQTPAAPAGALPAAKRILRPGSLAETSTGIQPSVRMPERLGQPPRVLPMSAEEYSSINSATLKTRYAKEPEFKARVDAYWAAGGR